MSLARFLIGDTRDVTATLPDNSVDLVLTSPPFLALRSYLPQDHADKWREIGSEADPAGFLDVLLDLTEEWGRVLAPHGSIAVELGDTYSGSGGAGGDYGPVGLRSGQPPVDGPAARTRSNRPAQYGTDTGPTKRDLSSGWPLPKSLTMIPSLYAASLAYGRNLLNPVHEFEPWRVRNLVAWVRPNPPVGALGDKFRPGTSYLTIATRSPSRYFDLDGVRTEFYGVNAEKQAGGWEVTEKSKDASGKVGTSTAKVGHRAYGNPAGAPPLDWWEIPTHGYPGSHYATFPPALLTRPIISMCPQRVCLTCGEPSRRIVDAHRIAPADDTGRTKSHAAASQRMNPTYADVPEIGWEYSRETVGWTDCGHGTWRPGHVLDPFGGSGTTGLVATGHGRDCTLIDIDARNADLARERIGMFLEVDDRTARV